MHTYQSSYPGTGSTQGRHNRGGLVFLVNLAGTTVRMY